MNDPEVPTPETRPSFLQNMSSLRRKLRLRFDRFLRWSDLTIWGSDMSLRRTASAVVVLISLLASVFLYSKLQHNYQMRLLDSAADADIVVEACRRLPSVDTESCDAGKSPDEFQIWSILLESGVIDESDYDTPAALAVGISAEPALEYVYGLLQSRFPRHGTGIGVLIELSRGICDGETEGLSQDVQFEKAIAYNIAGLYPAGSSTAEMDLGYPDDIDSSLPRSTLSTFRFAAPRSILDAQIAEAMIEVANEGKNVCSPTTFNDDATNQTAQLHLERLLVWGIGQVRTTAEYREAAYRLTLVTGPEQFCIFLVAIFALFLSFLRMTAAASMMRISKKMIAHDVNFVAPTDKGILELLSRAGLLAQTMSPSGRGYWKDQLMDQVLSARWPMRLAITTLPAIGFIGTVRGIMKSLTGADSIVWASTSSERAQAISALSADLGLAFATTMLALMFGVLLSILSAIEIRLFERAILPLFGARAFRDEPVVDGAEEEVENHQ
ncbi:MAG: MotA/TolQ/ExbB proton channel family protein [Roseovarius sp.]|nr:MotA/TolQ/ExbB proton channel family protein [Roseovarius sp.]